jgi:hypothetical protein
MGGLRSEGYSNNGMPDVSGPRRTVFTFFGAMGESASMSAELEEAAADRGTTSIRFGSEVYVELISIQ